MPTGGHTTGSQTDAAPGAKDRARQIEHDLRMEMTASRITTLDGIDEYPMTRVPKLAGNQFGFWFRVRWPRFFLRLASRVRPSTPPLSQSVDRHFLLAQSFGYSTDGIQTCPQTSHTATFCIRHPMSRLHIMTDAQKTLVFLNRSVRIMPIRHHANRS